ncbi:alpha/beta fold hydrolase [Ramlibacter sp. PS4R-6]|uniref:alpha/beta fold hydrolase n=1 Tax=Ramlibacter sp. PS4R-6 TaxID=3133438 RepID=UPI00309804DA
MPQLHFLREGRGPTIVLSHALGCDLSMWDEAAAELARGFTVLRYDHRCHGRSEVVAGPFRIEDLADDAAELIRRETDGPVHFVGLSMGGMVAQQVAVRHPELVTSVVVANSSSRYDDTARGMWRARIETALNLGMAAIADAVLPRWFTSAWSRDPANQPRIAQLRGVVERTDPRAYAACCEAISRIDFFASNPLIACPALVIAGTHDESTPISMSHAICNAISGAELATLPAAHLSAVERPEEFAGLVAGFISRI